MRTASASGPADMEHSSTPRAGRRCISIMSGRCCAPSIGRPPAPLSCANTPSDSPLTCRNRRATSRKARARWGATRAAGHGARTLRRVDLVEYATIHEVGFLRLGPTAEVRDRHQVELRELLGVLREYLRIARPIPVARDDFLALLAVKVFEVGLRHIARAVPQDDFVHHGYRRLSENTQGRHDDLHLIGPKVLDREQRFVLPRQQNIADATLHEGRGRAACAGVEHRYVLIEPTHELLCGLFVAARLFQGPCPRCEVVPACTPRGF